MVDYIAKTIMELGIGDEPTGAEWMEIIQDGNSRRFRVIPRTSPIFLGEPEAPTGDGSNIEQIVNFEAMNNALAAALGIPPKPTGVHLEGHTEIAEDGHTHLYVLVDWDAVTDWPRAHFEIKYTADGVRYPGFQTKDRDAAFPARSGVEYLVKVRTISSEGVPGEWSDEVPITPSKKLIKPTIPSGLEVDAGFRSNTLRWDESPDRDYSKSVFYRALVDDFAFAEECGRKHGTKHTDSGLENNTEYFYWMVHLDRSGNFSDKYPVTNVGGVLAKTRRVKDDDTDDEAPGIPTNLAIEPRTKIAADGTVQFYGIATWDAPAGATEKYSYELKMWDEDGDLGGPSSKSRRQRVPIRSGVEFTFKVRARTFNDVAGEWSDPFVDTFDKKETLPTRPEGLTVDGAFRANALGWDKSPDTDYATTRMYQAVGTNNFALATIVGHKHATKHVVTPLLNGTTYYYWITHLDRSGNESLRWPVSATGGIPGTPQRVTDDQTDNTPPGAPTALTLTRRQYVNQDGAVIIQVKVAFSAPLAGLSDKGRYKIRVFDGVDYFSIRADEDDRTAEFKARTGVVYTVDVCAINFNGKKGPYCDAITINPSKKSNLVPTPSNFVIAMGHRKAKLNWDDVDDVDYKTSIIYRNTTGVTPTVGVTVPYKKTAAGYYIDEGLTYGTTYYYWVAHVDTSKNIGAISGVLSGLPERIKDDDTDNTAPGAPTALTLTRRQYVDLDGKIIIQVKVAFAAPVGGLSDKGRYKARVFDGIDYFPIRVDEDDMTAQFKARAGVAYTVDVCAINFNGKKGPYCTAVVITPAKKGNAVPAPSGMTITIGHRKAKINWDDIEDVDYKKTLVYRNQTGTAPTAGVTVPYKQVSAGYFIDEGLPYGTTYYYWVAHVDTSKNIGAISTVVSGAAERIKDDDTDPTPPNVPTGLTVGAGILERLDDGTIQAHTEVSWVVPAAGVPVKSYMLKVTQNSTGKFEFYTSDATSRTVPVKTGKAYNYEVAAINAFGKTGAYTTAFPYTRSKKAGDLPLPGTVTIASFKRRVTLDWIDIDDQLYPDYRITWIYRNQTGTAPTQGTTTPYKKTKGGNFIDHQITNGVTYYYWICHVDNSGNWTALSTVVSSASAGNEVGAFADLTGTIVDSQTDPTAPGTPTAITVNPGILERLSDGAIQAHMDLGWTAPVGGVPVKYYIIKVTQISNGKVRTFDSDVNSASIEVKPGVAYNYQVAAVANFNKIGTFSTAVPYTRAKKAADLPAPGTVTLTPGKKRIKLDWVDVDDQLYPDYRITWIYRNTANTLPVQGTTTPHKRTKAGHFIDDGIVTGQAYFYWICHVDNSGNWTSLSAVQTNSSTGDDVADFSDLTGQITKPQVGAKIITAAKIQSSDPGGLVLNGKFIDGTDGWTVGPNTTVVGDAGTSPGGAFILRTSDRDAAYSDWFDVDYGEAIFARAQVYAGSAVGENMNLMLHTTDDANGNQNWYTFQGTSVKTTWTQLQGTVIVGNTLARRGRILLQCEKVQGTTLTAWNYWGKVKARRAAHRQSIPPLAISSTELDTAAVVSDKLGAGAVLSTKLGAGRGTNLLSNTNALLYNSTTLVPAFWIETVDTNANTTLTTWMNGNAWAPLGENVFVLEQLSGTTGGYAEAQPSDAYGVARKFPVIAGQNYEFHVLTGAHRCAVQAYVWFYTAADAVISIPTTDVNNSEKAGGQGLGGYKQIGLIYEAPATASYARVSIRKWNTTAGASPANSYGFFTHMYLGEAGSDQTEYSPWAENGNLLTIDATTDQTAPGTPTAITVNPGILERLSDGTIQAHMDLGWTAPVGGVPVKYYIIKVTQISNGKVRTFESEINSASIEVKPGVAYNYQVAAVANFNKIGTFSAVVPYTRAKKVGDMPAPGTVTIAAFKRRITLDWVDIDDQLYPDYRITWIYRNTANTLPTQGTTTPYKKTKGGNFVDHQVTNGQPYFYWICHVDNSGNWGALSTVQTATSGGNEVSGFTDLTGSIAGAQIPGNTVTKAQTSQTVPSTPSAPAVAQGSRDVNADGTVDMFLKLSVGAYPTGADSIMFQIAEYQSNNTTLIDTYYVASKKLNAKYVGIVADRYYRVAVAGVSFNQIEGSFSGDTVYQALARANTVSPPTAVFTSSFPMMFGVAWTGNPEKDVVSSEIVIGNGPSYTPVAATMPDVTVPINLVPAATNNTDIPMPSAGTYYPWVRYVSRTGLKSTWVAGPAVIATAYDEFALLANTVNDNFFSSNGTAQAAAAATKTKIEEVVVNYSVGTAQLEVFGMFRKVTAGSHTMDITIENAGGVVFKTVQNYNINAADGYGFIQATIDVPAGTTATIRMYILCSAAINVNNTKLDVNVRKR